jgi:hypothetical protein
MMRETAIGLSHCILSPVHFTPLDQYYPAFPNVSQLKNINENQPSIALVRNGIKPARENPESKPSIFHFLVPLDDIVSP